MGSTTETDLLLGGLGAAEGFNSQGRQKTRRQADGGAIGVRNRFPAFPCLGNREELKMFPAAAYFDSSTESSSTSKINVLFGVMVGPICRSP